MPTPPFLALEHPVYTAWRATWERNERRYEGGDRARTELARFPTERGRDALGTILSKVASATHGGAPEAGLSVSEVEQVMRLYTGADDSPQYTARMAQAVFTPLPERMATAFVGALMREAPEPDSALILGTLGRASDTGSRAAQVLASTSAPSNGMSWNAFWGYVARMAMTTGHRWVLCETPQWGSWYQQMYGAEPPEGSRPSIADERKGFRPYLVDVSPLDVPDWYHDDDGRLQYLRVLSDRRVYREEAGELTARIETVSTLYVRRGWRRFGPEYSKGGWWTLDKDGKVVVDDGGAPMQGTWAGAEIPARLHYYEASTGRRGEPALSRPGTTEIGQVAVSLMNIESQGDHSLMVSGMRRIYVAGGTPTGHNVAAGQLATGSLMVTIPAEQGSRPQLLDTGSVDPAVGFSNRQKEKIEAAKMIAHDEAMSAPESSGASKAAGFRDTKSPRLAAMAEMLEQSQLGALHMLEEAYGAAAPTGSVTWTTDFDLEPVTADIDAAFDLLTKAGAESAKLARRLMEVWLEQKGLLPDVEAERKAILDQLEESIDAAARDRERAADLLRQTDGDPPPVVEGDGDRTNDDGQAQ